MGPLSGIRIVDLTTVLLGPFATQIFADLGADVIRVESFKTDSMRSTKPSRSEAMAGVVLNLHRNKKSIVVDLKSKDGKAILRRLIATADVFVHNMRDGAVRRLGFGYDALREDHPALVYCSAYGFGRTGPYAGKPAYDDVIQAASGLSSLFARVGDGEPRYAPMALCDKVGSLTIAYAVMAALVSRLRTGRGQEVEVPMFESAVAFNLIEQVCGFAFDPPLERIGWKRMLSAARKPFRTADGHACILPYSDRNWVDFLELIGRGDLVPDPRIASHAARVEHVDMLYGLIEAAAPTRTTHEWMAICERLEIPAMPVLELDRLWDDPHLSQTGMLGFREHPSEGRYRSIASPVSFSGTPTSIRSEAPRPGEQTEEILGEIGYSPAEIDGLMASRVVGLPSRQAAS